MPDDELSALLERVSSLYRTSNRKGLGTWAHSFTVSPYAGDAVCVVVIAPTDKRARKAAAKALTGR